MTGSSSRRRLALVGIVSLVGIAAALALVELGGRARETNDACRAPRAAPLAQSALMPAGLSFDQIGTVTRVRKETPYVMLHAVTTKPLDQVTVLIQDAVTTAGYRPAGMDNEGFEAEVFFNNGSYAGGQALVRGTACKGRWDIELVLLDRDAVRSPTTGS